MPRQARLDAPGLLHHVIARGIERRTIFNDKEDYTDFIDRLAVSLKKSPNQILAWALMPNHFHLLVRSGSAGLPDLMRRFMTGYAVAFNRRHRRVGHLFQNRYKSIVCEEDPYLLELVRYIHLNPLRAGLVRSMNALRRYPWTGHAVLMGEAQGPWQEVGEILAMFGGVTDSAVGKYERFVSEAKGVRSRSDLLGGGLLRSMGGLDNVMRIRREGGGEVFDERVLGSGGFVEGVLKEVGQKDVLHRSLYRKEMPLESLMDRVAKRMGVEKKDLLVKGRNGPVSQAKASLICLATDYLDRTTLEMAKLTCMSGPAASKARVRGRVLLTKEEVSKLLS